MSNPLSNRFVLGSLVLLAILGWLASGRAETSRGDRDPEIRRLQQERLDLAKQVLSQELAMVNAGNGSPEDVTRSATFVVDAELELAESNEQIVAAHEKQVDIAKTVEAIVSRKVGAGAMRSLDLQLATYSRLGAEIDLLKAKQGGK
jgi:outer membrane protein TolC